MLSTLFSCYRGPPAPIDRSPGVSTPIPRPAGFLAVLWRFYAFGFLPVASLRVRGVSTPFGLSSRCCVSTRAVRAGQRYLFVPVYLSPNMEGRGSTGGSARFELLNETNYFTWKYRMEMQLIRKDLWAIVSGSETRPPTGARAQAAFDKRQRLAAAEIVLHVSDGQLPHTRKTTDPAEMWRILKNVHEDAGWANRMTLMRRFVMLRKGSDMSMQDHLNRFNESYQALVDIQVDIPDMLKVTVLLASLPDDYENVVTAIESHMDAQTATDPITGERQISLDFEYVARRLLNEEKRRALVAQTVSDSALVARGAHPRRPREEITCFECTQKGHYRNECPELKKESEKGNTAMEFAM